MEKNLQDAFNVISQVCSQFSGNLKDHQNIQHALTAIREALQPKEIPKSEDENE